MKKYFRDFTGATASIEIHPDGTATLRTAIVTLAGVIRTCKKYKNYKTAYNTWWRMCN